MPSRVAVTTATSAVKGKGGTQGAVSCTTGMLPSMDGADGALQLLHDRTKWFSSVNLEPPPPPTPPPNQQHTPAME